MNWAVLECGGMPTARIRGSMVTRPMAQAAASCMTPEAKPSPMEMMKVKRTTLLPALRMMK